MTTNEVPIEGGPATAKAREPLGVALLDLVTLGIYGLVWYYRVHRELAEVGSARGTSALGDNPTRSLLALVPGFLLIVPFVISLWNATRRVEAAERLAGTAETERVNRILAFVLLLILFPAGAAYMQVHLNRVWRTRNAVVADDASAPEASELVASS